MDCLMYSRKPVTAMKWPAGPGDSISIKSTIPSKIPDALGKRIRYAKHPPYRDLPQGTLGFVPELCPGSVTGRGNPAGFPSLKTLSVIPKLRAVGVTLLGQPSKRESLTLTLTVSTSTTSGRAETAEACSLNLLTCFAFKHALLDTSSSACWRAMTCQLYLSFVSYHKAKCLMSNAQAL